VRTAPLWTDAIQQLALDQINTTFLKVGLMMVQTMTKFWFVIEPRLNWDFESEPFEEECLVLINALLSRLED
jgi:hypothetical protein